MFTVGGKYTTAKVMIDEVEESAMTQLVKMVNHPAFSNPVAIMPDTHAGAGCVIGFTMPVSTQVCPAVVGVDIGCGVSSYPLGDIDIDFVDLDRKIRRGIPFGVKKRTRKHHMVYDYTAQHFHGLGILCEKLGLDYNNVVKSLGTLGGGNHFIEIGESQNTGEKWLTVHTGSRNFGKQVCDYHQKKAVRLLRERYEGEYQKAVQDILENTDPRLRQSRKEEIRNKYGVPKGLKGLETLSGSDLDEYLYDMDIAQEFATLNRNIITEEILNILSLSRDSKLVIESVHNFIDMGDGIVRKGAIRSYKGEKLVIPWNMAEGLIIGEGKSNPEWNYSAPHGAGRTMSRTAAKKELDLEEEKKKMEGIYTSVLPLDETPGAYKDSSLVEGAIGPTVKILDKIKPLHNMKSK